MRTSLCIVLGLCTLLHRAIAEEVTLPNQLDLDTALTLALDHNPGLVQARERIHQQDAVVDETQAAGRPTLSADSSYTAFDDGRQQSFGSASAPESTRWDANAEARIAVFSGGRQRMRMRAARAQRGALASALEVARQQLLADVHVAYFDAQLAQAEVCVREDELEVLAEQLKYAQNRYDAGVGARFDVLQAEVAWANSRPPLIRAQNDFRRRLETLRLLIGLDFAPKQEADDVILEEAKRPLDAEFELDTALAAAEQRPEFEELGLRLQATRSELEAIRRESRPRVDLFAGYGAESDQYGGGDVLEGWTAGVRLDWSLFDGGNKRSRARQAESALRQLTAEERELGLTISTEVRQSLYDYREAQSILEATTLVIDQAAEAVRLARNRYQAGRGTQLEVLESQLQLTRARLEETTALHALNRAVVRMKQAIGIPL